jgi:hypothetical protein
MRLNVGPTTKQIETKTPTQFASAMKSPLLDARCVSVTDASDHAALLKLLNTTPRPYAVCLLTVKTS